MKIRKGDQVLIIKGKDRGKKGKVLRGFPKKNQVLVEGVNIKKKHRRPRREGEKGEIVEVPAPIDVSKVKLICPKCGKPTRVGYKVNLNLPEGKQASSGAGKTQKSKVRICKKCKKEL
ncbi:MAG: 50S ribosomal protein L24 [Candidatus Nealsonbacteria bacterium]|nr:MAG: 50S ribosomal protein L24 [Candidatus Nealsonbacteria bacterium]